MSVVYYKFKSTKTFAPITFDGLGILFLPLMYTQGISGFDVKREIMNKKQLGKGLDLDLEIFNASSNQELSDDTIIPRNTQIIVKRLPPAGIFHLLIYTRQARNGPAIHDPSSNAPDPIRTHQIISLDQQSSDHTAWHCAGRK